MNNIKILIPAKGTSKRCPFKNQQLLPIVAKTLCKTILKQCVVISDDYKLLNKAKEYGFNTFYSNITTSELEAMYDYIKSTNYNHNEFIHLPLTQPFRNNKLIKDIKRIRLNNCDFVCSVTNYVDRNIFLINKNNEFINPSTEGRKGNLCKSYKMIDGAIYKIKTKFLKHVIKTNNTNKSFWNGKFKTINNNMPFLDVDDKNDMKKLQNTINLIKHQQNNKINKLKNIFNNIFKK